MVSYLQRVYTVVELRTGFVAGSSMLIGCAYGIHQSKELNVLVIFLLFISAFTLNLVANIAAEISGYYRGEDTEDFLTGHRGSEGLMRQEASLKDAISILLICIVIAGITGLSALIISRQFYLLLIGLSGLAIALLYSLTPIALAKFPVSELVSGLMCGFGCTLAGIIVYIPLDFGGLCLSFMTLLMVSFLMAANNTCDIEKDRPTRITWPHLIGFRRSITILIPQIIILFGLWIFIALYLKSKVLLLTGLLVLTYFGVYKWYFPYYQVRSYQDGLGRIYGPLPLVLLLNFNFIMSIILVITKGK